MSAASDIEFEMMKKLGLIKTFSPSDVCEDDDVPEKCATQFDHDFYKCLWYSRTDVITSGSVNDVISSDDTLLRSATYKIDHSNFDILSESQIIMTFPSVKIKDKYRKDSQDAQIAWTPYPLINFIVHAQLKAGDTTIIDPFDTVWLMNHLKWNTDPQHMHIVEDSIGNRPCMLNWSDSIPSQTCYHKLPFGYSYSSASALPLYLFNSQIVLTKVITYHQDPIGKLLMMRITEDGKSWTHLPADPEMLDVGVFLPPSIEMKYHKLLPDEKQRNLESDVIVIPIHNVISLSGKNRMSNGLSDSIPITTMHPLLGIFAVARNLNSEEINYRSNFTNSVSVPGEHPISQFGMKYDNTVKFQKNSDSMRSHSMLSHFKNVPKDGYLAYAYSSKPFDTRYMVGPTLTAEYLASIILNYGQSRTDQPQSSSSKYKDIDESNYIRELLAKSKSESHSEKHEVPTDKSKYISEVRALIFRDLIFSKNDNGVRTFTIV